LRCLFAEVTLHTGSETWLGSPGTTQRGISIVGGRRGGRSQRRQGCRAFGFTTSGTVRSRRLRRVVRRTQPSWWLPDTSAAGCSKGTRTSAWKRSVQRWKPSQKAAKWGVMTQTMTQTLYPRASALSKLLKWLVDLIGIEPMTSSMPWYESKRKLLTVYNL